MKNIIILIILFLTIACKNEPKKSIAITSIEKELSNEFVIINQDYNKALKIATRENKMIFVDFYTTWCAPCKKLDKLVFKNDSIQKILKNDFILLKYDAENDSIFHLSKKHHVNSYPTGLILNNEGYVINRKSGFVGNDFKTLSSSFFDFTNEGLLLNNQNKKIEGYSNKIEVSKYPKFYIDYVNRTNTKFDAADLNEYWTNHEDIFSEEYFSTLIYFASETSNTIARKTLNNKEKYIKLYGKTDVNILMTFLTYGRFDEAVATQSKSKFNEAVAFAKKAMEEKNVNNIVRSAKIDLLKAQNKWDEVLEIYKNMRVNGEFDHGYANHFSWQVYKNCDDKKVIQQCLLWMKEATGEQPEFDYLDTYARLLYKSGDTTKTKEIAHLALIAAKKEERSTKGIDNILAKL